MHATLYGVRRSVIECRLMDISFNCPRCGQNLCVEERGAGMLVDCPKCNEKIEIPRSTAPPRAIPIPATAQVPQAVKRANYAVPVIVLGITFCAVAVIIAWRISTRFSDDFVNHVNQENSQSSTNLAQDAPFDVELKEGFPRGRFLVCNVTFNGTLPPPETVDKIVHDSLQSAALSHPTREILAMAWHGDDTLEENQYSGNLIYEPAERRIMTLDESRGVKTTGFDVGAYYVAVREDKTLAGIKPERKWLSLSIVFPSTPSVQEATDAAIAEIENRLAQGLDIDAFVKVGDKGVKTSWKQMPDPAGGLLFFRYTVANRTIYNKSTPIKKLP
jgi:DNA-directed RNA polymerase subunit RPC12/RpoP